MYVCLTPTKEPQQNKQAVRQTRNCPKPCSPRVGAIRLRTHARNGSKRLRTELTLGKEQNLNQLKRLQRAKGHIHRAIRLQRKWRCNPHPKQGPQTQTAPKVRNRMQTLPTVRNLDTEPRPQNRNPRKTWRQSIKQTLAATHSFPISKEQLNVMKISSKFIKKMK